MKSHRALWRSVILSFAAIMVASCTAAAVPTPAPTTTPTLAPTASPTLAPTSGPSGSPVAAEPSGLPAPNGYGYQSSPVDASGNPTGDNRDPQAGQYVYKGYDRINTASKRAAVDGYVYWYFSTCSVAFLCVATIRGEFHYAYIWATKQPTGCIYLKVTWAYYTGSVSLPPGVSGSSSVTTDGYYKSCRRAGENYPRWVEFSGYLSYASHYLSSVTVTVCDSTPPVNLKDCSSVKRRPPVI